MNFIQDDFPIHVTIHDASKYNHWLLDSVQMEDNVSFDISMMTCQGGIDKMEDDNQVIYIRDKNEDKKLSSLLIGVYDGHGGTEAVSFAAKYLLTNVIKQEEFFKTKEEIPIAIMKGFSLTQEMMKKESCKYTFFWEQ